jgi:hypothetical protein
MKRIILMLIAVLITVLNTACGDQTTSPPAPQPTPTARQPIIPDTTKVTDAATRTALSVYDPASGTMRFSASTPVLKGLKPDDVLVSEPSAAAPDGYLRKVKAIRTEGNGLVLATTQANLTDAISQGDIDGTFELQPSDLRSTTALVKGLTLGVVPKRVALAGTVTPQGAVDLGDGYNFQATFANTVIDVSDGDFKGKITISGRAYFNAGYTLGIGIDDIAPPKRFLPEVDRFEASIGIEQAASLHVSGETSARFSKEVKVGEYRYKPKCFVFLVPVCVVPTLYLLVGTSGEVSLNFDYGVVQTAQAKVGAKWEDGPGWSAIDPTPKYDYTLEQKFDLSAAARVKAYLKSEGALMIYGVAGPKIGLNVGVVMDAVVPRNPFWTLSGTLDAYYGFVVDLPVVGRLFDHSETLFALSKEIGRSANAAPKIVVDKRSNRVDLGQPLQLGFFKNGNVYTGIYHVTDPEDGLPTFTLNSDRDGPLPVGSYTFASEGLRTVTIAARDSQGATSTDTFTVDVVNSPPVVFGSVGSDSAQQTVPFYIGAAGSDPNSKLDCSALSWTVDAPDTVAPDNIGSDVCYGRVIFNIKGTRTVRLTARDPQGALSPARTFSVTVTDPPANPPPTITQKFSLKGTLLEGLLYAEVPAEAKVFGPLTLSAAATDPDGVTYIFSAQCQNCQNPALKTAREIGRNTSGTLTFDPVQVGTWIFGVNITDGSSTISFGRTVQVVPVPPR